MDREQILIPGIYETDGRVERAYDPFSLLFKERIVFLGTPINDQVSNVIVAQLLYLDQQSPEREIQLYINCPGGEIYPGLAIYDTMQMVRAPIRTIAVGWTASLGTRAAGCRDARAGAWPCPTPRSTCTPPVAARRVTPPT